MRTARQAGAFMPTARGVWEKKKNKRRRKNKLDC